ncbi:helix-turn-helix domain-containing protein [Cumulibacter soli]|uniref:helix-turn-helix domain-containing protein n=1 Tax=Cumulibacter soli TaxID=2546344 RepID=UPI0014195D5E|nr:helix-turn-helix transcriptional regulator [Cumulibacter soli]
MTRLSERLQQANAERQLTVRQIADIGGDGVDKSTISRYLRGQHPASPRDDVLQTFSKALGVPVQELRELAGRPGGEAAPYKPPPEVNQLTAVQRRALDGIIRAMAQPHETNTEVSTVDELASERKTPVSKPTRSHRSAAAPSPYSDDAGKRIRRQQDADAEDSQE